MGEGGGGEKGEKGQAVGEKRGDLKQNGETEICKGNELNRATGAAAVSGPSYRSMDYDASSTV